NNNKYYEKMPEVIEKRGIDEKPSFAAPERKIAPGYWWLNNSTVKAIAYDISNKNDIKLVREVELEGHLVTSRKIGSHVYLLANKDMGYVAKPMAPLFRDSNIGEDYVEISYNAIQYFPERSNPNYLLIAAFDLNDIGGGTVVDAFIGSGNNVYMSHKSLYVAVGRYNNTTAVYKFKVDGVDVDYVAKGAVLGNILNQFSMDEHKEHFRIATTDWNNNVVTNNVFVLDPAMKLAGKIENIAPGERIYSARFMGDKGYLVTFEMVDPLFVLDLSNPHKPTILGELKIPGFSNYLHPLDENHLLGIGKDTDVMDRKDHTGKVVGQFVVEKGMKLAIFDVSDVNNPKEKYSEIIGGRGTYSEVLNNHKALLFNTKSGTLAFPVTIYEQGSDTNWGAFNFQGAIVYNVSLTEGFSLKGKITHISGEEYSKSSYRYYDGTSEVKRALYIGENFYAISDRAISAHNMTNLKEVNRLNLSK
ncbi:MAG: beta-propeller domain-containing protein, partial [Bacillota bacterium]|nr:beta-propeller domain-containing protein [Bacillota bacterium]